MRKHFAWNPRLFLGTHDFLFGTHDFFLRTHDFFLGTHDFLPTTHDFLPTTHDFLPTTHDFLPTTHDFLPTTHDILPTTHDPRLLASPIPMLCIRSIVHYNNIYSRIVIQLNMYVKIITSSGFKSTILTDFVQGQLRVPFRFGRCLKFPGSTLIYRKLSSPP